MRKPSIFERFLIRMASLLLVGVPLFASGNTVTVRAFDRTGKKLEPVKVVFFKRDLRLWDPSASHVSADFASYFQGPVGINIPYGDYSITIEAGGMRMGKMVHVRGDELLVLFQPVGYDIDTPIIMPPTLGKITAREQLADLWIRVVNSRFEDDCCALAAVSPEGNFTLPHLEPGEYVFIVNSPTGVLLVATGSRNEDRYARVMIDIDIEKKTLTTKTIGGKVE